MKLLTPYKKPKINSETGLNDTFVTTEPEYDLELPGDPPRQLPRDPVSPGPYDRILFICHTPFALKSLFDKIADPTYRAGRDRIPYEIKKTDTTKIEGTITARFTVKKELVEATLTGHKPDITIFDDYSTGNIELEAYLHMRAKSIVAKRMDEILAEVFGVSTEEPTAETLTSAKLTESILTHDYASLEKRAATFMGWDLSEDPDTSLYWDESHFLKPPESSKIYIPEYIPEKKVRNNKTNKEWEQFTNPWQRKGKRKR